MTRLKQFLSLAPAPLFFLMGVREYFTDSMVCGAVGSMTAMWLLMAVAHCLPWIVFWQSRQQRWSRAKDYGQ